MHRRLVVLALLALVATACSDDSEEGPADSGTLLPAGGGGDAGTPSTWASTWAASPLTPAG